MTVSLTSILSSYGYGTTGGTTKSDKTEASAQVAAAVAKLSEQKVATRPAQSTVGTQVSISAEALAAATARDDNAKDFAALAKEVRASLDGQYAAGTAKGAADLSKLSGRALSAIALNKDGQFSPAEARAARQALREETRASFVSSAGYGAGLSAVAGFSQQLAAQYDAMSPEERQARGWTEQFRDSNASFGSRTAIPSLFDQI